MSETQQGTPPEQTPTGEIKDQSPASSTTPETPTPPETTPASPDSTKSLLNEDVKAPDKAEGAPEKYEDFKVPEGYELDADVAKDATALFKELGLPQAAAQKLVDFYSAQSQQASEAPFKAWHETQEAWKTEIKADPEIGGKLDTVKTTIARAIDGLGDAKLAADFRQAMDYTGAGNNPAFIRAFYRLAAKVTEGSHVSGQPQGSRPRPVSAAAALYPNLPHAG